MKRCPTCNRTYTDLSLNFCLEDGTPLTASGPAPDPNATIRYPDPRDTSEPPPTEIYRPAPPATPRPTTPTPAPPPPQQWRPMPQPTPQKKSNAVWWILGGLAAVLVIGVGLVVMLIALASLGANSNNTNLSTNRNENRNSNSNITVNTNSNNSNSTPPASFAEDFSDQKWSTGVSQFGRIWYDNGEYHMVSKERTFVVMYSPRTKEYNTENATVSVTARSVDGSAPSAGFGLMVHCEQKEGKLEDYALLIYPSDEPEYRVIKHKAGTESTLVDRTKSDAIKPGSAPNKLEIRIKGGDLWFYANGQYLTRINDSENFKRGRVGLYTSDIHEVAFDDLSIER